MAGILDGPQQRIQSFEALAKNLDSTWLRINRYMLALIKGDRVGMAQQLAWSVGKAGVEDVLLALEADTAAYSGRLAKAREFSRRAVASAQRAGANETAADYEADAALREALFGNPDQSRERVRAALGLSIGRDVYYGSALALALTPGSATQKRMAEKLAADLGRRFPEDTVVQFHYLPTIRAQLALRRNEASKAVETLQVAASYELGSPGWGPFALALYPAFVRGEAYLAAKQGREAAAEFQKILDHRSVVLNEPIGAVAHLGLARAYTLSGDSARARTAYQEFFALWKDADPDVPILKQPKDEYAQLH